MASQTQIKIRYGMILEHCVAQALDDAGIPFEQTVQYDEFSEVPDFLIPNASTPRIAVECHQMGARNSLMMKALRVFTAVAEVKKYFGSELVAASVVFGDLGRDFATSPIKSLCAAFDSNLLLQNDPKNALFISEIEALSLDYAKELSFTTEQAGTRVCKEIPQSMERLSDLLKVFIDRAQVDPLLKDLWNNEIDTAITDSVQPVTGATYWKKALLQSLFLNDEDFQRILDRSHKDLPMVTKRQGQLIGVLEVIEEIDGDHIELHPALESLCNRKDAHFLRQSAKKHLDASVEMKWFFEDIRDSDRREAMSEVYINSVKGGRDIFTQALYDCATKDNWMGIHHKRCWFADLISLTSSKSFNHYNNKIFRTEEYPLTLWCPYSHIVLRTDGFVNNDTAMDASIEVIVDDFFSDGFKGKNWFVNPTEVADLLLQFRIKNAIKLRKLSPLLAVTEEVCSRLGLAVQRCNLENFLYDVAAEAGVGRFLVYVITCPKTGKQILFNAVAGYENPTDKAKEWSARCLALRYRCDNANVVPVDWLSSVFLMDGEWKEKDQVRLRRGGWEHLVQLDSLEPTLRSIFSIDSPEQGQTKVDAGGSS